LLIPAKLKLSVAMNSGKESCSICEVICATVEDGVLKPEQKLALEPGTRVRLIVDRWEDAKSQSRRAVEEFDKLCEEIAIESEEPLLTRDQLHERR
jgi:predicted DNA-binding antitoxin AbrB/MazE fold protein